MRSIMQSAPETIISTDIRVSKENHSIKHSNYCWVFLLCGFRGKWNPSLDYILKSLMAILMLMQLIHKLVMCL